MVRIKHLQVVLVLVVLLLLSGSTALGSTASGPAIDRAGGHEDGIEVVLSTDGAPGPGGVATLTLEATPLIDAPDLTIEWIVPEGAELLGDPAEAFQVVASGSTVTSQRQVRFPSTGTYKIIAAASYRPAEGIQFVATGVLFFVIEERGFFATDRDPDARSPMHTIMSGTITASPDRVEGPQAVEDDPCFTIQGYLRRWDREPTTDGYLGAVWAWVRHAVIEVREEDLIFDDSYGDLLTNEEGHFAGTFCDDDGWFDDTLEIYVRVRAELRAEGMTVVEVEDNSWIEEVYEFDSAIQSSGGGTLTFNLDLNEAQSHIFNIADAIYEAWDFWNYSGGEQGGDAIFDDEAEVQWEPGWGQEISRYDPDWEEILIADDPSNPDPWDDAVIMHEWTHFADDEYSCDDNPGGKHYSDALVDDPELSWGEGYPDYYQSAVRWAKGHEDGEFYIDVLPGNQSFYLNLETWDVDEPTLLSVLNEIAIAAALWDLYDLEPDGQDNVYHGPYRIQDVYTSEAFQDIAYGFWDDTCDFDAYARAWVARGWPADKETAAAIKQNTGYTLSPSSAMADLADTQDTAPASELTDAIWWDQLTYVVDNSQSMAGPKFDAVKTVLGETINDLEAAEHGTEFTLETFNNTSLINQEVFVGQFFGSQITPAANGLSTSAAADTVCRVHALRALNNAIADEYKGEAWLFTDGDTYVGGWLPVTVEGTISKFNNRQMHASIALMGVCPVTMADVDPEEAAEAERLLRGAARPYVGAAADETPGGVVPYLLTAIGTGGQFLFVDESQMADAADVLRAQFTHSAGAGSWSDYVSDQQTYRWDNLTSWEYNWIDATAGTDRGNPATGSYLTIPLPQPFVYYGYRGGYDEVNVFEDGYLTFGAQHVGNPNNTEIPNTAAPNNALYPFWDALAPKPAPTNLDTVGPNAGEIGRIYTRSGRNEFAIEYYQYQSYSSGSLRDNIFQVQLNDTTGEIRYLYDTVPDGAASATIGLENRDASDGVQVSYNQGIGAANGTGYKFTPAPPQPTKTFSTTVDSLMNGVAFLLMGYSGSFEPLKVQKPDGTLVNCHDVTNVLCIDLGLVQYVQADVDRNYGVWKATVDAGPTGSGTFSFVSMAASELSPEFPGDHTLSTAGGTGLAANMGQPVDGDMLTGWFVTPEDTPFGPEFPMYDDGAHGDGFAGDGKLGSDPFSPPGAGCAYLRVRGLLGGVEFVRTDRIPFCFHPLRVISLGDGVNFGEETTLQFEVHNDDLHDHCYNLSWQYPEGWSLVTGPTQVCIAAEGSRTESVDVYMGANPNSLPSGTTGEVILSAVEAERGEMSDSDSAWVTRRRPIASITIHNPAQYLRPGGDSAILEFVVLDEQHVSVADGTLVNLASSLGKIVYEPLAGFDALASSDTAMTKGGYFKATFLTGPIEGTAVISASVRGVLATTQIEIGTPPPSRIRLEVADSQLPADGSSTTTLRAIVTDPWRTPMGGQTVRIGLEGDGQTGTVNGGEVVEGTTNSSGEFSATFTSSTTPGMAWLRAELLYSDGGHPRVIDEDRQGILLGRRLYLPIILRTE